MKHFAGEYPNLKKQTVFEFKKAHEKLKSSQQGVTKVDSRKRGRPKRPLLTPLPMTERCLFKMVGTYLSVIAGPETFLMKWNEMAKS